VICKKLDIRVKASKNKDYLIFIIKALKRNKL